MVASVGLCNDASKAKEIARRFFEQHYSVLETEQAILQNDAWIVNVLLSSSNDEGRKVRIDAKTGRIIDWSK